MSVREYIGARYIPLFADPIQWDITREYEPLTVVTDQGNSYVSRQAVPAGISLDNTDYWLLWADYNAQLQAYIQQVQAYNGRISTLENDLPISAFDSVNTIDARFDVIEANSWVSTNRIADANVTTAKIADGAITSAKLADANVTTAKIADGAITSAKLAEGAIYETDNPIYYGADPTGVSDSTQAIQDCIDANEGNSIVFSPGIYKVTDTINLPYDMARKVSIEGNFATLMFYGTFIKGIYVGYDKTDASMNYAGKGAVCFINDLYLNYENANVTYGIDIENGCKDVIIQNVKIYRATNGIRIGNEENTLAPSDTKVMNCLLYGKGSEYESTGIISICTDNNVQLTRIYGYRTGVYCKGTIDIETTQVLLRWENQDTVWDPYDVNSMEFDRLYRSTCFAEIHGPTRIINSYADSTYMFVNHKSGNLLLTNSFYFNSRSAYVDCKVINIDANTPNIKVSENEFQLCGNTLQQSYGVYFERQPDVGYTQAEFSNNIITGVANLEPYDLLKCNYGGEANAPDIASMNPNNWYVFGCIPMVNAAGGANEKTINVKVPNAIIKLYTFFNAGGTSGTLQAEVIASSGTHVTDFGIIPLSSRNQNYWLLCYKPVSGSTMANVVSVDASAEVILNMFSSGRNVGAHPSAMPAVAPSTPSITASAS